jgi:alkylation response protein AidB-like acyl-CoA dehydrogenase
MDFQLSADQLALQDAAEDLLAERSTSQRVRRVVDAGGGWDRDRWGDLVEQGWTGLLATEAAGGIGLGWVEAAALLEVVGRHLAAVPILPQLVAVAALADGGAPDVLEELVAGSSVAAIAHRPLAATTDGDGWRLAGATEPVAFAPSAQVLVAAAGSDDGDGPGLYLAHVGDHRPPADEAMDLTREFGRYRLDGLPATRIGGPAAVEAHLDRAATAHAAEMLGCAGRALDMAVVHARDRQQFGRPIGSFQAVKHRCADMLVDVEGMRSATWWAAWCLATDDPQRSAAASTAKVWCSDAADRVLTSALQVHGGIGFTWESDLHLHLKRVEFDRRAFGTAADHRDRLAGILRDRVRSGVPVM